MKSIIFGRGTYETRYFTLPLDYNLLIQMFIMNLNSLLRCFCTCYFCFSKIVYNVLKPIQDTLLRN